MYKRLAVNKGIKYLSTGARFQPSRVLNNQYFMESKAGFFRGSLDPLSGQHPPGNDRKPESKILAA